jgi:hypothetical protein
VWSWPKSEEDYSEFYTSFVNNANDKLGKEVVVKAEFPAVVENDGYPKPITELQLKEEEAVWTISLSNELAAVIGFERTKLKPGTFRSNQFNEALQEDWHEHYIPCACIQMDIDVLEPLVYYFTNLCNGLVA